MNLAPAERAVTKLMTDDCTITRDSEGVGDDTWDDVLGTYTRPSPDESEIYSGKCMVLPTPLGSRPGQSAAVEDPGSRELRILIPLDQVDVAIGDVVTVTASRRDPALVDRTFAVIGTVAQTFAVYRQLDVRAAR